MLARVTPVLLALCLGSVAAHSQSLADLVNDAKADWMFTQWEAQSDNGDTVKVNISWDLEKKVAVLHVTTSEMESKGYTAIDPVQGRPIYVSFDSRGAVGKGSWDMESDQLTLRLELQSVERGPWKAAFVFGGSADSGLEIRMHTVGSSGELEGDGRTFKFKKAKVPAAAKAK